MGLDLTLCPDRFNNTFDWFLAHTRLDTMRSSGFYDAIKFLDPQPLTPQIRFQWYGDEGIEGHQTDPYGAPLTWLDAGTFRQISPTVCDTLSPWNRAVLLFLQALPPQTRVVLWWH